MGCLLLLVAAALLGFGPQIGLAAGQPWITAGCLYAGWVVVLFALLRWLLPGWSPILRIILALIVPIAIAAIVLGVWLRALRGRN